MKNNKTRFFYVLHFDNTWVFDQPELVQDPIYIIIDNKLLDIIINNP